MKVRRKIAAAIVAGGMLLLGAGIASGAEIVVVRTLGRKVAEVKTASARWTVSAQGEYVDDNYVTKPDPNALRGRAAVKETSGVRRIRIHDVTLQQRQNDGVWKTVAQRTQDVVDERRTAYAVAYTPTVKACWSDDPVRTYRVVQNYGVRQTSGTATNRSLTSNTFGGPMLASDPACPRGAFNAWLSGPSELTLGESQEVGYTSNFISIDDGPVQDVTVVVNFDDSFDVEVIEASGLTPDESTADPNDYFLTGATWPSSNDDQVAARFLVTPTELGRQASGGGTSTSQPKVQPQSSSWEADVVAPPEDSGTLGVELEYTGVDASAWPVGTREVIHANWSFTADDPGATVDGLELRVTFSDGLEPPPEGPLVPALHTPEPDDWYFPLGGSWPAGQTGASGFYMAATAVGQQTIHAQLVSSTGAVPGEDTLHVTVVEPPEEG